MNAKIKLNTYLNLNLPNLLNLPNYLYLFYCGTKKNFNVVLKSYYLIGSLNNSIK